MYTTTPSADKDKLEDQSVAASTPATPAPDAVATEAPAATPAVPKTSDVAEVKEEKVEAPSSVAPKAATIEKTTSAYEQLDTDSHETQQVVVFKLENEEYAAPILEVQEIIPTGDITHFPNVPEYIEGIINVRGTVATVINISRRFNLSGVKDDNTGRYIILTKSDKAFYGIMVDEVTSVMKIPVNKIKPATGISQSKINNEYVSNVAIIDDRVILILDFKKILDEEALADFADKAESKAKK